MRFLARTLAAIWACGWTFFALASGAGSGGQCFLANVPNALPELAWLLSVAVAWRWEVTGGILLCLCGMFAFFFFHVHGNPLLLLTLVLPPLAAGILFVACGRTGVSSRKTKV